MQERYFTVGIQGMDEGQISNATSFKTEDNHDAYRIVRLNKKSPAHQANLHDDYDAIMNAALANAKTQKMRQWARKQMANTYVRLSDEYKDCVFKNLQ